MHNPVRTLPKPLRLARIGCDETSPRQRCATFAASAPEAKMPVRDDVVVRRYPVFLNPLRRPWRASALLSCADPSVTYRPSRKLALFAQQVRILLNTVTTRA